jgi:CRP/FNR family cyclic AMP-dependent transcriptional regulator
MSMRDRALISSTLARSPIFMDWPPPVFAKVVDMARIARYKSGARLHQAGEPVDALHVVVSGALQLGRSQPNGRQYILVYLSPGEAIGLIPAIDGKGALFNARAHADTSVVIIPWQPLRELLEAHPKLLFGIATVLCARTRLLYEQLELLAMVPLPQRLARMLLILGEAYGRETQNSVDIDLRLSQDELAAMIAVSRQRVNAEIRALVKDRIVLSRYGHVVILDRRRLLERAGLSNSR